MNQKLLDKISLCQSCNCMTKTIKGKCGKCGKMKSLDKKKTNIEIVDTDIFSIGTDGGNKPIKPINLDKNKTKVDYSKPVEPIMTADNVIVGYKNVQNKPKELEWEKTFYDNFCSIERNPYSNETFYIVDGNERNPEKYLKFIQSLLTQQRTELLEQILNLECLKEESGEFDQFWLANQLRKEIIDEIKKL